MTLDEIRVRIDAIDTQMKPLFVNRMECAAQVAAAKAKTGGDVFVCQVSNNNFFYKVADNRTRCNKKKTAHRRGRSKGHLFS